ncbi:MAG: glycosyltransferase family 4 protein [Leptospiraceae bacterium]|nr:glycosyltransferase family 4 protein [Leptospiraceae bacterium]NUM42016.1 glycosyltransferase family 4 protein [Leptospiraceae bacterium]
MKNIHQFSAGFNPGDAISNEMLAIQKYFSTLGIGGNLYSENIGKDKKFCKKFKTYSEKKSDLIIYHHSIHSNVLDFVLKANAPKILIYHNVTPYQFFQSYDLKLTHYLKKGREELSEIREKFLIHFSDSKYNCDELSSLGFENVIELPIVIDFSKFSAKVVSKKTSEKKKIIFVGRLAPNKKQDDLIRFAKIYKDSFNRDFQLWILGNSSHELKSYKEELELMIRFYDLKENVFLSNFISDEKLIEHYSTADLFLSLSEHEGFCVPLIESMFFSVPILAYSSSAVPDTLGDSGILFNKKDFLKVSVLADRLLFDRKLKEQVIEKERERLKYFQMIRPEKILQEEIRKYFEL